MSEWLLPQAVERHLVYLLGLPTRMRLRMPPRRPVSRAGRLRRRQLLYSFQEGAQMELGDVLAGGWCPGGIRPMVSRRSCGVHGGDFLL